MGLLGDDVMIPLTTELNANEKLNKLIIMLNGIRNMAKQEAENGSEAWSGVVEDIDRVLSE